MKLILLAINIMLALLPLFSGPYTAVAFKFRSFGGIRHGCMTWLGIALVFPVCVLSSSYGDRWWLAWLGLIVCAYIQMTVKWISTAPPLDTTFPHCWIGRGEPFFAFVLAIAAQMACGMGGMAFFLTGYACSTAERLLRRLRLRCETWAPSDTARLLAPARNAVARLRAAAHASAASIRSAVPIYSRAMRHYGLVLASATARALRYGWVFLVKRAQQPAPAYGQHYARPPGFVSRVMTFFVGHMLFSLFTGAIGFWGIMKGIGLILAIPSAIVLWGVGVNPDLPLFAKEDANKVLSRVHDALEDKKEDAIERFRVKREEMKERWDEKRDQISGEVSRKSRWALWNYFTR